MAGGSRPLFLDRPPDRSSPVYRDLLAPATERAALVRAQCDELWRDFQDLADETFREQLPIDFPRRWFEMYLGAALRRAGLDVRAPKPGPDFCIKIGEQPVYLEAIAPTPGQVGKPETVRQPIYRDDHGRPVAARVPHDLITLRLTGAFVSKARVFASYRDKKYIEPDAPCIIAINLSDIPHARLDADEFWFRALYGIGDRFVAIDRTGGATVEGRKHRSLLERGNGAPVDVAPLLNADRAHISGVLGSAADVANVPNPLGDEFLLMPHATALRPYPPSFLRRGVEVSLSDADVNGWKVATVDYGAREARGPERLIVTFEGRRYEAEWTIADRTLSVTIDRHRCDVLIRGGDDAVASARAIAYEMLRAYQGTTEPEQPCGPDREHAF